MDICFYFRKLWERLSNRVQGLRLFPNELAYLFNSNVGLRLLFKYSALIRVPLRWMSLPLEYLEYHDNTPT